MAYVGQVRFPGPKYDYNDPDDKYVIYIREDEHISGSWGVVAFAGQATQFDTEQEAADALTVWAEQSWKPVVVQL